MANQIRITPDQMRERASQYNTEANAVRDIITKMDTLLTQLQSEWEGDSSVAFAERYNELKPGFVKGADLIEEISKALTATANIVEQTDAEIGSQFRS